MRIFQDVERFLQERWRFCLVLPLLLSCSAPPPPAAPEAAKVTTRDAARLEAPGDERTFGATTLLPSAFDQQLPALSSDGTGFLAVWVDARVHGTGHIRGARMAADGTLADPVGFAIGEPVDNYRVAAPGIAWNGNEHFVVWQRGIDSQYTSVLATVESAFVSPSGAIRRANVSPRLSLTQPHAMKVAAGAHGFLAAWSIGTRINGLLFDESGTPAAQPVELFAGKSLGEDLTVVFDGTNYLVVGSGQLTTGGSQGIWARRFNESAAPVDAAPFSLSGDVLAARPSAARVGDSVLVTWEDSGSTGGTEWDLQGALVTPGSTSVDRFLIADGTAGNGKRQPALAFDGTHALVAWSDEASRKVLAVRITAAGSVVAGGPITVLDPQGETTGASVAFSGGTFLVAGTQLLPDSGNDVVAARVSPEGTRIDAAPVTLSMGAPAQLTPRVAWSRDRALLVWSAWNGTDWDIHGVRLDANFQPLDATPFVISGANKNQETPDVVSSGEDFLVVWRDDRNDGTGLRRDIYGARVTAAGTVKDAQGMAIAAGGSASRQHPRVAVDGRAYVVGWWQDGEVKLAQVDPAGWVSGHVTVAAGSTSFGLACTTGGICATVLPMDYRGFHPLALYRFDALLTKLNEAPMFVSSLEDLTQLPGLTFDGTRFVAAWKSTKKTNPALLAARFTTAGAVLDAKPVEVSTEVDVREPQLTSDGHAVVLTWIERTVGSWRAMARQFDTALVGAPAVALAKQPTDERASSIAVSAAGATLAVWEQDDPGQGAMRVHASMGSTRSVLGTACGTATDCRSGFCVDGVCCDSACGGGTADCNACSMAAGAAADGTCGPRANATCDDGKACTEHDVCEGSSCVGAPKAAPAPGPCQVVTPLCDPETGDFPTAQAPDGTVCDTGECRAGACMPKDDPPPPPPDDGEPEESGCGCTTGPGAAGTSFLLLLTLAGVLRRRAGHGRKRHE
ncbi:hypothetical protein HMI49_29625 [Corallococcus exercitus]|uniref:Disintegrin domain-containing protein n=1 Tax=Corallococcus exercitus TaxID=2316736 RepID=A0A7Y4KPG4_9BACT|nr:MYXO-CTERM sorting domain-containing protein [Corallococcus exercitus]NOK37362.1 hypothetical protein [Corallococcus exercitus]